eukprot:752699-Hanusia_phi.AAC.1
MGGSMQGRLQYEEGGQPPGPLAPRRRVSTTGLVIGLSLSVSDQCAGQVTTDKQACGTEYYGSSKRLQ